MTSKPMMTSERQISLPPWLGALVAFLATLPARTAALPDQARRTARAYAHRPQHALRSHTPAVRYPVGEPQAAARHYAPLEGRARVAWRIAFGATLAAAVLLIWQGFDIGAGVGLMAIAGKPRRSLLERWVFAGDPDAGAAITPVVESHTPAGTALADRVRAELEQNGHVAVIGEGMIVRKVRPPQDLGKAYGRASQTIHHLRGQNALLREGIGGWVAAHDEVAHERDELLQALDERRPAPDPGALGQQLKDAWFNRLAPKADLDERWTALAETAIDAVRGLWPREEAPTETSSGGGVDAEATPVPTAPGAPAPDDTIHIRWCKRCSHQVEDLADRRICDECEAEVGTRDTAELAASAEASIEQLAETIAGRDLAMTHSLWAHVDDRLREHYRAIAADVVNAGWLPPGTRVAAADRTAQVPVIASLLVAHELSIDDGTDGAGYPTTCRCGWDGLEIHHVEHVAEQLVATGAIA